MKRFRRTSILSVIFTVLTGVAFFFLIGTGNILFTVAAGIFVILASFTRKKESLSSYRDRYEQAYGLTDAENSKEDKKS